LEEKARTKPKIAKHENYKIIAKESRRLKEGLEHSYPRIHAYKEDLQLRPLPYQRPSEYLKGTCTCT